MNNLQQAAHMALEALDGIYPGNMTPMAEANWRVAADYLRAALAEPEPEPEPVAYIRGTVAGYQIIEPFNPAVVLPESAAVYLHPPRRKPLSDGEIFKIASKITQSSFGDQMALARAIEAAHGITGETNASNNP